MASFDVSPTLTTFNLRDMRLVYSILIGNFLLSSAVRSDRSNLGLIKFDVPMFIASRCSAVLDAILHIVLSCSPSKILNDVVRSASVKVHDIKRKALTGKGLHHQSMNTMLGSDVLFAKSQIQVSVC